MRLCEIENRLAARGYMGYVNAQDRTASMNNGSEKRLVEAGLLDRRLFFHRLVLSHPSSSSSSRLAVAFARSCSVVYYTGIDLWATL